MDLHNVYLMKSINERYKCRPVKELLTHKKILCLHGVIIQMYIIVSDCHVIL